VWSLFLALAVPVLVIADEPGTPRKRALVVGVSTYQKAGLADKPLPFAAPDMSLLGEELKKAGWDVRVLVSRGTVNEATRRNVLGALDQMLDGVNANDLILVALSGHGQQFPVKVGDTEQDEAFFCPSDGTPRDGDTLIGMTELMEKLGRKGGRNLMLVDACRDDPRRGGKGVDGNAARQIPGNTAVLFSCAARQQSFETNQMFPNQPTRGHGVFFHRVLQGLGGEATNDRGEVTWTRLVDYVCERVNDDALRWFPERAVVGLDGEKVVQTPHLVGSFVGKSPVLVKRAAAPAKTTAAKPAPPRQTPKTATPEEQYRQGLKLVATKTTANDVKALALFREAAEKGHGFSQGYVGYMYAAGRGTSVDMAESAKWFRRASITGDPESQFKYAWILLNGTGVPANAAEGARWMAKAAGQGYTAAINDLGFLYEMGQGVKTDLHRAREQYLAGAAKEWGRSQCHLGRMAEFGISVEKNQAVAAKWYRLAADQGHSYAQDHLASMLWEGRGVEKDRDESFRLYKMAADNGYPRAQANLGWMHAFGHGTDQDIDEAVRWYKKAVAQGDAKGQLWLGSMYETGTGVEQNRNEAVRLYRLSANQGETEAVAALKKLGYEP